jgi:hypothetical protein
MIKEKERIQQKIKYFAEGYYVSTELDIISISFYRYDEGRYKKIKNEKIKNTDKNYIVISTLFSNVPPSYYDFSVSHKENKSKIKCFNSETGFFDTIRFFLYNSADTAILVNFYLTSHFFIDEKKLKELKNLFPSENIEEAKKVLYFMKVQFSFSPLF